MKAGSLLAFLLAHEEEMIYNNIVVIYALRLYIPQGCGRTASAGG